MTVWMEITLDKYELPVAVAMTRVELARLVGVEPETISEQICRYRKHGMKCKYIKVEIEDE